MATRTFSAIGSVFDVIGSAFAVSRAIESRRTPRSDDLRRLGIDPREFRAIRTY